MDASAGIPLGRYLLGEKLAAGGMGEVYVAIRRGMEGFEKPLALKLLLPHLAEEQHVVKMFLSEARLCARMSHPHIVQIFDLGLEEKRYFLAMELVHGVSLVKLVRVLASQGRPLPTPLILLVARALLDALHYAHTLTGPDGRALGLIHRDVTPHNILVSVNGEVKLTDFGIAKVQEAVGQTRPGVVRGKMDYLAPEQLRYERPDARVDVYAAGLTLFFLATGRSAFGRATTAETLKALREEPLPSLGEERPDLPRELVEAITRATAKDPEQRFPSARAFRDALPPPSLEERPEALGALVKEVCPAVVGTLDRASRTLALMNASGEIGAPGTQPLGGTSSLSEQGGATTELVPVAEAAAPASSPAVSKVTLSLEAPPPRERRRPGRAVAVLGLLLVLGLGAGWWMLGQEPTPVAAGPAVPAADQPASSVPPEDGPKEPAKVAETEVSPPAQPVPPDREVTRASPARPGVAAPPRPRKAERAESSPPRPATAVGYLTVDALPWARVAIGGKAVGETPLARFPVPAGSVELELRNPETGKVVRRRVQVRAGKEAFVKEDLR